MLPYKEWWIEKKSSRMYEYKMYAERMQNERSVCVCVINA